MIPADPQGTRIDYHHHALLPEYTDPLAEHGIRAQPGVAFPRWSAQASLRHLDQIEVDRALLSIASPGFWFAGRMDTIRLTTVCSEGLARLRDTYPERLGFMAPLPLPHTSAAMTHTVRALDVLGADGISLLTSYGDQQLGDAEFDEILTALDERDALVHVHPTIPCWWPGHAAHPPALIEYPFETTRAILSLAARRVFSRFPRIRWVFAHGGGTLPYLAARIFGPDLDQAVEGGDGLAAVLKNSRFDSALISTNPTLDLLATVVGAHRIVLGSDYPFVSNESSLAALQRLQRWSGMKSPQHPDAPA